MKRFLRSILRGTALFFGLFSLANTVVSQLGNSRLEDIWWVDFSFVPAPLATLCSVTFAALLIAFALKPTMRAWRRIATSGMLALFALVALFNTLSYYKALQQGTISADIPVPFTLIMMVIYIAMTIAVMTMHETSGSMGEWVGLVLIFLSWFIIFPLAQIQFFGHTDYRKDAQIAVVFGARVYPNGNVSEALKQRLDTAVELYEDGNVSQLYLTGGIDADGVDETKGMLAYVVKKGVPADDCILDNKGSNTDASVSDSIAYFKEHNITDAIAVSQFYHMARIKMAYRADHFNVYTVPAKRTRDIPGEEFTVMREIPAFWVYWLRSGLRDIGASAAITA